MEYTLHGYHTGDLHCYTNLNSTDTYVFQFTVLTLKLMTKQS